MNIFRVVTEKIHKESEIISGLTPSELREKARKDERTTEYGSPSYITRVRSRSAKFTEIIYGEPTSKQLQTLKEVQEYLRGKRLICVERSLCQSEENKLACRLYVTEEYARIPYMWVNLLFPPIEGKKPDLIVVDVPEWREINIIVEPEACITYILGTDYFGEVKKAFLRMAMYLAKKKGGLGLHAGSKIIRFAEENGKIIEKGTIFFGLSGTGKTSLTCHHHWLEAEEGEGVVIRQDDVILMKPDASCIGTEDNFYIKTEGLEPKEQPLLFHAATSPNAILENVYVDKNGKVDFFDEFFTSNGRAIILRSEMAHTDNSIDLPKADVIIFITRRDDIVPPVAKLTLEQAAAFFMLGESIETSAGDPTQAGKSKREVGTNPFIIGPEYEEGNIFFRILKANPGIECFLLNTGRVGGKEGKKITIRDSTEIIKQIVKGKIKWKTDPDWGYEVPVSIEGMDISSFDPTLFYTKEEYKKLTEKLKEERKQWLNKFEGLDKSIVESM